ncbi:MAG TPA: GldG family protein [Opitutaceae bacterium]|nr:GldG family protein [Opitutaceae bacterium]
MHLFESFRAVRWLRTFNLILQAVLFLTFFGGLNYVARNHPSRFDLTRQRRFSLAPETLSYLKNLSAPVHIVATVSDDVDLPSDVSGLLDEFVHATENNPQGRITKEIVNVYQNRRRAEELSIDQPNVLYLTCGENHEAVTIDRLYQVRNRQREGFQGEQVLISAILEVSNPNRPHVYFLVGHGELQPDDTNPARGLSSLRDELDVRNFKIDTLDLSIVRKIPSDAALLVAVAPQTGYSRTEEEMLRQYLTVNAGRLILALAPGISAPRLGLDDLLLDWGVLVFDDVICETDQRFRTDDGDLIIRSFDPKHPIVQTLLDYKYPLQFGYARTVCPDPARTPGSGLNVTTLAAASPTAWGDVGYRIGLPPKFSNQGNTHPIPGLKPDGQLGVAVASERVSPRDNLPFSVRAGRLVVFGCGDFIANQRLAHAGNEAIFLNAVNWAVERDRQLNVPVRPIQRFQLAISAADLSRLNYTLWFALPGATALLGLIVLWTRRK